MGIQAMAWARNQRTGDSTSQLCLLILADMVNDHRPGEGAWPSLAKLADEMQVHSGTVQRALRRLEEGGWLSNLGQEHGRSCRYVLSTPEPDPAQYARAGRASGAGGRAPTRDLGARPRATNQKEPEREPARVKRRPVENVRVVIDGEELDYQEAAARTEGDTDLPVDDVKKLLAQARRKKP